MVQLLYVNGRYGSIYSITSNSDVIYVLVWMFLSCHHTSQNKSQRFEFGLKEAVGEDKVLVGRRRPVSQDPQVPTDHTRLGVGRKTRTTRNSQEQPGTTFPQRKIGIDDRSSDKHIIETNKGRSRNQERISPMAETDLTTATTSNNTQQHRHVNTTIQHDLSDDEVGIVLALRAWWQWTLSIPWNSLQNVPQSERKEPTFQKDHNW